MAATAFDIKNKVAHILCRIKHRQIKLEACDHATSIFPIVNIFRTQRNLADSSQLFSFVYMYAYMCIHFMYVYV